MQNSDRTIYSMAQPNQMKTLAHVMNKNVVLARLQTSKQTQ